MRAHEYSFKRLLSLLSNSGNLTSFRLSNKKLSSKDSRLVRRSRVCSRIYLCSNSSARLYHSTMFHDACGKCLESLSSLVSHSTNGSSFDFRARSNDQITEDCSEAERMHEGIEDHLVNASPVGLPTSNVETSVHTYLGGLFLV